MANPVKLIKPDGVRRSSRDLRRPAVRCGVVLSASAIWRPSGARNPPLGASISGWAH